MSQSEANEGKQGSANRKWKASHRAWGDILPFLKQGSANWLGGLKAFSTLRGWKPPDNTDSAETTAYFLTGRYDSQPQCHSNTFKAAVQIPIRAV